MKELAQDIGADYVRADTQDNLLEAIRELPQPGMIERLWRWGGCLRC